MRNGAAFEDPWVELPRPTAGDLPQRLARDVLHHVRQRGRLVGDGAEPRERVVDRRVDAQRPERDADAGRFHLGVGPLHHRVEQDQAGELVAVVGRGRETDPAAHAVRRRRSAVAGNARVLAQPR